MTIIYYCSYAYACVCKGPYERHRERGRKKAKKKTLSLGECKTNQMITT
jgi:hypothetical protein